MMVLTQESDSRSRLDHEWIASLFLTLLAILCSKVAITALWNLFFHPLASFPGPRLAALSNLYQAYYDVYYRGKFVEHLHDLHARYGPVVRVGPNELHFSSPEAYKDIYHSGSKFVKEKAFYKTMQEEFSSFGTWDPVFHRKRKDTMNPLFSRRAILKLESSIQEKVDRLIQILLPTREEIDLFCAFRCFSLDVVYDYTFGEDAGAISYPFFRHPIILGTEGIILNNAIGRHLPIIDRIVSCLPSFIQKRFTPPGFSEVTQTLGSRATEFVERKAKVQQSDERETIFNRIVDVEDASWKSLFDEGMNLTFAGTDTVANACIAACFYVHSDAEMLKRLREELRNAWPDVNSRVSYEVLEKLPYLTAVIKESLRLSIGVPVGLLREVQPASAQIMGYEIPRGTIVSVSATFMHWNPDVFPDPHKFSPKRWLQDRDRKLDSYLVPFSRGPRQCIGMNLAWCELYLLLGYLFRRVDLKVDGVTHQDMRNIYFSFVPVLAGGKHLKGTVKGSLT
ncbi:hypothetical protein VKT23_006543 [Stygiomarasmius scandens]|uniref:Cytochrome P450 n=1 Tax=Marasmiellus scandens TaxID=2682957 RepID=A0ABR1JN40_9AGAR